MRFLQQNIKILESEREFILSVDSRSIEHAIKTYRSLGGNEKQITCFKVGDRLYHNIDYGSLFEALYIDRYNIRKQLNNKFKCALDVGAADGLVSLLLSDYCDKVIAIEPITKFWQILSKNLNEDCFQKHHIGLLDQKRTKDLSVLIDNEDQIVLQKDIRFIPGDELDCDVDLIKIDTANMEFEVLEGLKKTIEINRPFLLMAHYLKSNFKNFYISKVNQWLIDQNYTISFIDYHCVHLKPI